MVRVRVWLRFMLRRRLCHLLFSLSLSLCVCVCLSLSPSLSLSLFVSLSLPLSSLSLSPASPLQSVSLICETIVINMKMLSYYKTNSALLDDLQVYQILGALHRARTRK